MSRVLRSMCSPLIRNITLQNQQRLLSRTFSSSSYSVELINDNKTILLTLNSNVANFLNHKTMDDIDSALNHIAANPMLEYKPMIITSPEESKCFSAGMDLKMASKMTDIAETKQLFERFEDTLARIATLRHRTIAKIHGHAVGAGFFMGLACDVRCGLDDDNIMISLPETEIGIPFPSLPYHLVLSRMSHAAHELLVSKPGKALTPKRAYDDRYLTDLVSSKEELMERCIEEADRVKPDMMKAYLSVKEYLWRTTIEQSWNQDKEQCLQEFVELRHSAESQRLVMNKLEEMKSKKGK